MVDRELIDAEELDFHVEIHQAGQAAEHQPDLPHVEWDFANKLLGISASTRPDVGYLADLENLIHETARKPADIKVEKCKPTICDFDFRRGLLWPIWKTRSFSG